MSDAIPEPYRHLTAFLQSWFHQDFDLAGDTMEEIVTVTKQSATRADLEAIVAEIAAFPASPSHNRAVQFEELFDLDIDPLGFVPSMEAFLGAIARVLTTPEWVGMIVGAHHLGKVDSRRGAEAQRKTTDGKEVLGYGECSPGK